MKWLEKLLDADFLLKHIKVIIGVLGGGVIICLLLIYLTLSKENIKEPLTKTDPTLEKQIQKVKTEKEQAKQDQDRILKDTLEETFTFGELTYKTPDISELENAFLNSSDLIVGSYKEYILFKTQGDGLYFYNIEEGSKEYVTDLSLSYDLSSGELYYLEIEDRVGNRLMKYDIKTNEKEELASFGFNETISNVSRNQDNVYYILNENGKSHLQSIHLDPESTNTVQMNIELPIGSFLEDDGKNSYLINNTGFYKVVPGKLERIGDTPQVDYLSVKVWEGQPLIYGYNSTTKKGEVIYQNKVLVSSDSIFEMWPINSKYLLVNDLNNLKIIDKDTLKNKTISPIANNSVVVNGDILFSIAIDLGKYSGGYYYYFEQK